MNDAEKPVLNKEVFEYLKEKAPEFLQSYAILASFYTRMSEDYVHKVWKDGRLVLTPIKNKTNEQPND